MAPQKFKYNINHFIALLPKVKTTKWVATELDKEGINERTFYRDKAILASDSSNDISGERLLIYAKFFSIDVNALYNYNIKIKPVFERKSPDETTIKLKSGLK